MRKHVNDMCSCKARKLLSGIAIWYFGASTSRSRNWHTCPCYLQQMRLRSPLELQSHHAWYSSPEDSFVWF